MKSDFKPKYIESHNYIILYQLSMCETINDMKSSPPAKESVQYLCIYLQEGKVSVESFFIYKNIH